MIKSINFMKKVLILRKSSYRSWLLHFRKNYIHYNNKCEVTVDPRF